MKIARHEKIKEIIEAQVIETQDDLAQMAGVRRETIVFLEQGKYNPSLNLAHKVAQTLQTTIDNLFDFED